MPTIDAHTSFETEAAVGDYFDVQAGSTASLDTSRAHTGTKALKIHKTGTANASTKTRNVGQVEVFRGWFNADVVPSANYTIFNFGTPTGSFSLRHTGAGKLQGLFSGGGTVVDLMTAAEFTLDTWHVVDVKVDCSGTVYTADVRVNGGAAETQMTSPAGQTAGNIDEFKVDTAGTVTCDYWVDELQHSHDPADYPIGADYSAGTVWTIDCGHIASGEAVRGVDLARVTALAPGHISTLAAVRGVTLTGILNLSPGHVPSAEAVRGVGLSAITSLTVGHIPSGEAVRGVGLGNVITMDVGHILTGEAVRGVGLTRTTSLAPGHVPSAAAVHGLALARVTALAVGHVPSGATVYGLLLTIEMPGGAPPIYIVPVYNGTTMLPLSVTREIVQLFGADQAVNL